MLGVLTAARLVAEARKRASGKSWAEASRCPAEAFSEA
jgi:hypothetical protein